MHVYLFPALEKSPEVFASLLRSIPRDVLDEPSSPGRFTPREVIAHLADWEPILREERIAAPIASPGLTVAAYDEGELAERNNYAAKDPHEQAALYAVERQKTVALLKSLTEEQWRLSMKHPERGEMTVYDMANLLVGHDMYHVEQLVASLR